MKKLFLLFPVVLLLANFSFSAQAQFDIEASARFTAAFKHLMACGLRNYEDFSGLSVWLGSITKSDIEEERRKIAGLRGWVAMQPEPNRTAYRDVLAAYDGKLNDANDEAVNHTIKKRQDEYKKTLSSVMDRSEIIYRSMQSPCHSTGIPTHRSAQSARQPSLDLPAPLPSSASPAGKP